MPSNSRRNIYYTLIMTTKTIEHAQEATDLDNLLDHIAWEKIVQPALVKYRDNYQNMLVSSVLGQAVVDTGSGQIVTKEMLAGRIHGIEWINKFLLHILKRGDAAQADLIKYDIR